MFKVRMSILGLVRVERDRVISYYSRTFFVDRDHAVHRMASAFAITGRAPLKELRKMVACIQRELD